MIQQRRMAPVGRGTANGWLFVSPHFGGYHRCCGVALLLLAFVGQAPHALADADSLKAIHATPADLAAVGLTNPLNGNPFTPTGSGVIVAVAEAADGIPQLNPPNNKMAGAGTADGQINIVATPPDVVGSHATMVNGIIVGPTSSVAPSSRVVAAGHNTLDQRLQNSQALLSTVASGGQNASILNWSLSSGAAGSNGTNLGTQWADWAAITQANHPIADKLIVIAGNESASNTRFSPWDNFNGITVGATAGNGYTTLASYNGVAGAGVGTRNVTTDTSPYGANSTRAMGRFKTDIVAPGGGDGKLMASPVVVGSAEDNFQPGTKNDGLNSDPSFAGTSFAAPHVSGAAALLTEYGIDQAFSTDHKVLKAILLNGAETKGLADHNGAWAAEGSVGKKNGDDIYIGWDADLGTGKLDVARSFHNYAPGEMNPGVVGLVGWDIESVAGQGLVNEYDLDPTLDLVSIRATLDWDRFLKLNDKNPKDDLWQPGEDFTASILNDLDLEIWDNTSGTRVFYSSSDMDSIEHVDYSVPDALRHDDFSLRVRFYHDFAARGPESYGLAWDAVAVPEPTTAMLLALGVVLLGFRYARP